MGVTTLNIKLTDDPNLLCVHFSARNWGAMRWAAIVDAWPEALERVPDRHARTIRRLDPLTMSLGRGARFVMTPIAVAYAFAEWERVSAVTKSVENGELDIDGIEFFEPYIERARRRVAEAGEPAIGEPGADDTADVVKLPAEGA